MFEFCAKPQAASSKEKKRRLLYMSGVIQFYSLTVDVHIHVKEMEAISQVAFSSPDGNILLLVGSSDK